jgi:hypothetical protein
MTEQVAEDFDDLDEFQDTGVSDEVDTLESENEETPVTEEVGDH